ncbi:MAG: energy transducer TonB [Magnetococcales bacterium]|nr:energy transducer TonB [Magnetococcales bacterium]
MMLDPAQLRRISAEKEAERYSGTPGKDPGVALSAREDRHAAYLSRLHEQLRNAMRYPESLKGLSGKVRMTIIISRNGTLESVKLLASSGAEALDQAALASVHNAAPFAPLPDAWKLERIPFTFNLEYFADKVRLGR